MVKFGKLRSGLIRLDKASNVETGKIGAGQVNSYEANHVFASNQHKNSSGDYF